MIELKHNKCAESALDQIKEKKYFDSLKDYKGGLLFTYDQNNSCATDCGTFYDGMPGSRRAPPIRDRGHSL